MSGPGPIKAQHQLFSDQMSRRQETKPSYTKSGDFQSAPFYPSYLFPGYGGNPYSSPPSRDGFGPSKKTQGPNSFDIKTADVSLPPYKGFYGSPVLLKQAHKETSPPVQQDASLDQSEEHENSGIKETKRFLNNLLDDPTESAKREKL